MEHLAVLQLVLKILYFTIVLLSRIPDCYANEENSTKQVDYGEINISNAEFVTVSTASYMLKYFSEWENKSISILLPIDSTMPNDTLELTTHFLNQVALHNKRYTELWEVWLQINPTTRFNLDLDYAINLVNSVNQVSDPTITTILLDYGFLYLTPDSYSVVQEDVNRCNRKMYSYGRQCGVVIDSINCLTSRHHLPNLGLKPGNIFIVGDDVYSYNRNSKMFYSILPCLWTLKDSKLKYGYKTEYVERKINPENQTEKITGSVVRRKMEIKETAKLDNDFYIDYIIADGIAGNGSRPITKFNPLNNIEEWLSRPTEFDKNLFGVTVYSSNKFVFEEKTALATVLEMFPIILVEMDDTPGGTDFVRQLVSTAQQNPDSVQEFQLVMNIFFEDFELNRQYLHWFLSVAATGNGLFPGKVTKILFNWAVPLRKENSTASTTDTSGVVRPAVKRFLGQAKMTQKILEYVDSQNITNVRFGILWEIDAFEDFAEDVKSKEDIETLAELNKYLKFQRWTVRTFVLKVMTSLDFVSWKSLLYLSRTKIHMLTSYINRMRGAPSQQTAHPVDISVYFGMDGCKGGPQSNISKITEYLLFWEVIQIWAIATNVTVIVNGAFEREHTVKAHDCLLEYMMNGWTTCMCGLWHVSNTSQLSPRGDRGSGVIIEDKKSIGRRLYEGTKIPIGEPSSNDNENGWRLKHTSLIVFSTVIFCAFLGAFTMYMVRYYQRKDLISRGEVQNFLLGVKDHPTEERGNEGHGNAHGRRYNNERFEILPVSFSIDFECQLGQGEFGTVYKGVITKAGISMDVAVKMKSGRLSDGSQKHGNHLALRGIISEIKILSYVGDHPNIVKLEGAYTAKLRKGTAIVFLELCSMGSLDKHLRTYEPQNFGIETGRLMEGIAETGFVGNENVTEGEEKDREKYECLLPIELRNNLGRWSQEIACGMEFLTTKKLVHADLATRNVLLDSSGTAKISDFGLSRRLYNYEEYVKQEQASLPWRWMAPEALRKLTFNEKTDVWAFGVTLWEMYTLGDIPYPGLAYHINFPALLSTPVVIGGVRLAKPKYSSNKMYEIMQGCWEIYPGDRPSFAEIVAMLTIEN